MHRLQIAELKLKFWPPVISFCRKFAADWIENCNYLPRPTFLTQDAAACLCQHSDQI